MPLLTALTRVPIILENLTADVYHNNTLLSPPLSLFPLSTVNYALTPAFHCEMLTCTSSCPLFRNRLKNLSHHHLNSMFLLPSPDPILFTTKCSYTFSRSLPHPLPIPCFS